MRTSPEAFFDAATIINRLAPELGGASQFEIQRVAYLACLLALYDGNPLAEWGYLFIRSDFGAPFGADLNAALELLVSRSMMTLSAGRYSPRSDAAVRLQVFLSDRFALRQRWLIPACDSALFLPASTLALGIDREPTSMSAALQDTGQPLLTNSAQSLLYEQIQALRKVLGLTTDDLLTPSMVWMTYSAGETPNSSVGETTV